MNRLTFLALHRPFRSPSQRYRFDQFLPHLAASGWDVDYSHLIREQDDSIFYGSGNYLGKMGILARSVWKRWREIGASSRWDLAFIQREAFMLGTAWIEQQLARRVPTIFDFDDAIWQQVVSEGNRRLAFLKDARKTEKLIACASEVWAGNAYLATYAAQFNDRVQLVPTVVDTAEYAPQPSAAPDSDVVCIGWSGSFSTVPHFEHALPALQIIQQKYGQRVRFKLIGDSNYRNDSLHLQGIAWSRATELRELSDIHIGLMPLPDDIWTRGKCGLKALVYMAMQIPTVVSPVGVNREILEDSKQGFWATTTEDWVDALSTLIENPDLRQTMGKAGRERVVERYSVAAWQDFYTQRFEALKRK